jgi:succinoglycan biosynthesis transport protein ExoP
VSAQFAQESSFDPFEYVGYLRSRWKFLLTTSVIAVVLTTAISLIIPKRYTATATILIDAPAGNDPRAATAVSPVYLESLRTYERFADSDTLFVRAMQRFNLREESGSATVDGLKRRVLKVRKLRDTKLLEVSVTLADPTKAQAVVQFIAEETVSLNSSLARRSDDELTEQAHRQAELARDQLDATQKFLIQEAARFPLESAQSEMRGLIDLKAHLERELMQANADLADYGAQRKAQSQATPAQESDRLVRDVAGIGARVEVLRKELDSVTKRVAEKDTALAQSTTRLERLEGDRRSARVAYDTALARWNDAQSAVGNRGERLKIVDPGIVPQRPSFPNLPLNVFAALSIAFLGALLYASFGFISESRKRSTPTRAAYR